jgi:hypothetical protein
MLVGVAQNTRQSMPHLKLSAPGCSSLLLISFNNPRLLVQNCFVLFALSLLDYSSHPKLAGTAFNTYKDHYRTYERKLSAATEAHRSARSRSPPDLLATSASWSTGSGPFSSTDACVHLL